MLSYLSILAIVIIVLNTYPLLISRNLVFASKQSALLNQANQIGMSIGSLDSVTQDSVANVMTHLNTGRLNRITVVNSEFDVLYQDNKNVPGMAELNSETLIRSSLQGNDETLSRFENNAFLSGASVPILSRGQIAGSVYIFEYDANEGSVITGLQHDLARISLALTAVTVIVCLLYSGTFTSRITNVLNAIRNVREGEYTYRIHVKGHDELAQLSEEFNSLTKRLQTTEETRRRFVADASHDLKTPLASIRLLSDSILQNTGMDSETVNEFVSDIRDESERLAKTTGQLLDLTRLDYSVSTSRNRVNCAEVAEQVLRMLRPIAEQKSITLSSHLAEEATILASDSDLYQIIVNLAENAIKYNNPGGKVDVTITIHDEMVEIRVEDNGIGIPDEDLPYIFDRFYRVDKSRSREEGGSGLGLSIVKSTAEKHGGTVSASHNPTGGTVFSVIFPLYYSVKK